MRVTERVTTELFLQAMYHVSMHVRNQEESFVDVPISKWFHARNLQVVGEVHVRWQGLRHGVAALAAGWTPGMVTNRVSSMCSGFTAVHGWIGCYGLGAHTCKQSANVLNYSRQDFSRCALTALQTSDFCDFTLARKQQPPYHNNCSAGAPP